MFVFVSSVTICQKSSLLSNQDVPDFALGLFHLSRWSHGWSMSYNKNGENHILWTWYRVVSSICSIIGWLCFSQANKGIMGWAGPRTHQHFVFSPFPHSHPQALLAFQCHIQESAFLVINIKTLGGLGLGMRLIPHLSKICTTSCRPDMLWGERCLTHRISKIRVLHFWLLYLLLTKFLVGYLEVLHHSTTLHDISPTKSNYSGTTLFRISEIKTLLQSEHCLLSQLQRNMYKTTPETRTPL